MSPVLAPQEPSPAAPRPAEPPVASARPVRVVPLTGWPTAAREFLTIVASVLVALAGQAWWQGREDRGRERDYLRQLLADTRENERRIASAVADDSVTACAMNRLVDALTAPGPMPPADSMVGWTVRSGASASFQPLTGTFAALVGAGDLRLVRDDSLRSGLVTYFDRLASERELFTQMLILSTGQIDVLPRKLPYMRRIFVDGLDATERARFDFAPLRGDVEFAALLFRLQAANSNRLGHLRVLLQHTRELRRALEAALPGSASARPRTGA